MNIENLFVSEKVALLAKDKKFDEPCLCYFRKNGERSIATRFGITNLDLKENFEFDGTVTNPLYQQLLDWLLEEIEKLYSYVNIKYFSDYSGEWILDEYNSVGFDNKESMIIKGLELI